MVHRQLIRGRSGRRRSALALALALPVAPSAWRANRRVAISHYQWSTPQIQLDLGEHVTWYWVGPDTMHSVTGSSANDAGLDSDPARPPPGTRSATASSSPLHPGHLHFQCKLHPTVRGTVHVSSAPGDPTAEADPIPESHVDLTAPYVDGVEPPEQHLRAARNRASLRDRRARGRRRRVYRLAPRRYPRHRPPRRRFAGWQQWHAHVGYNDARFANRGRHFRPVPGRYVATVRFTDASNNTARPRHLHFTIRG